MDIERGMPVNPAENIEKVGLKRIQSEPVDPSSIPNLISLCQNRADTLQEAVDLLGKTLEPIMRPSADSDKGITSRPDANSDLGHMLVTLYARLDFAVDNINSLRMNVNL